MNDFLQNLRNGQAEKQRTGKTRKNYDNAYRYSNSRFHSYPAHQRSPANQSLKRQSSQQTGNQIPEETTFDLLAEAIDSLSLHVEAIAKNQEFLIIANDRAADMLERQAVAIESIVKYLHATTENTSDEKIEIKIKSQTPADTEKKEILSRKPARTKSAKQAPVKLKTAKVLKRNKGTKAVNVIPVADDNKTELMSRKDIMDIINSMRANGETFDEVAKQLIELKQPTFSGRGEWHAQTIHRLCNKKKK